MIRPYVQHARTTANAACRLPALPVVVLGVCLPYIVPIMDMAHGTVERLLAGSIPVLGGVVGALLHPWSNDSVPSFSIPAVLCLGVAIIAAECAWLMKRPRRAVAMLAFCFFVVPLLGAVLVVFFPNFVQVGEAVLAVAAIASIADLWLPPRRRRRPTSPIFSLASRG